MKVNGQKEDIYNIFQLDFSRLDKIKRPQTKCIKKDEIELKRKQLLSLIKDEQENHIAAFTFGKISEPLNIDKQPSNDEKTSSLNSMCEDKKEDNTHMIQAIQNSYTSNTEMYEKNEINDWNSPRINMIPKRRNHTTDLSKLIASLNKSRAKQG